MHERNTHHSHPQHCRGSSSSSPHHSHIQQCNAVAVGFTIQEVQTCRYADYDGAGPGVIHWNTYMIMMVLGLVCFNGRKWKEVEGGG